MSTAERPERTFHLLSFLNFPESAAASIDLRLSNSTQRENLARIRRIYVPTRGRAFPGGAESDNPPAGASGRGGMHRFRSRFAESVADASFRRGEGQ